MLLIYKSHGYDKFGQRTYMKYCNGAETFYTYEPQRRRLQGLKVNAGGNTIMDNAYTYDAVSNVLGVTNGAALPQSGKAGGQMSHSYAYDALYACQAPPAPTRARTTRRQATRSRWATTTCTASRRRASTSRRTTCSSTAHSTWDTT